MGWEVPGRGTLGIFVNPCTVLREERCQDGGGDAGRRRNSSAGVGQARHAQAPAASPWPAPGVMQEQNGESKPTPLCGPGWGTVQRCGTWSEGCARSQSKGVQQRGGQGGGTGWQGGTSAGQESIEPWIRMASPWCMQCGERGGKKMRLNTAP